MILRLTQYLLEELSLHSVNFNIFILGNIVTGNDTQTDAVLAGGALPTFCKLLASPKANIVKVLFLKYLKGDIRSSEFPQN